MSARAQRKASEEIVEPWPCGISREPELSIGQLVERLKAEFPAITQSKVRFLEDKGLVVPARTSAGYRKYSQADLERLRYVLASQRDSYSPLDVIRDQLRALDAGHEVSRRRAAQDASLQRLNAMCLLVWSLQILLAIFPREAFR